MANSPTKRDVHTESDLTSYIELLSLILWRNNGDHTIRDPEVVIGLITVFGLSGCPQHSSAFQDSSSNLSQKLIFIVVSFFRKILMRMKPDDQSRASAQTVW